MKIYWGLFLMIKRTIGLSLLTFLLAVAFTSTNSFANGAGAPAEAEEMAGKVHVGPNPQRGYCVLYWNKYYSDNDIEISVSSKGLYDEVVVFTCPDCSLEEHYVEPFLNSEANGVTGLDRIKACGFVKAVFKGAKGLGEISRTLLTDVYLDRRVPKVLKQDTKSNAQHIQDSPFESLDSVSEPVGEVSTEPSYTQPSIEPGYQKPLGVREAEGRPIGN